MSSTSSRVRRASRRGRPVGQRSVLGCACAHHARGIRFGQQQRADRAIGPGPGRALAGTLVAVRQRSLRVCGGALLRALPGSVPAPSACFDVEVSGLPQQSPIALGVIGSPTRPPAVCCCRCRGRWITWACRSVCSGCRSRRSSACRRRRGARWRIALPAAVGLRGVTFQQQAVVLDPGANAAGAVASNAGTGVVGGR